MVITVPSVFASPYENAATYGQVGALPGQGPTVVMLGLQDSLLDMLAARGGRFSVANIDAYGGVEAVCGLPQVRVPSEEAGDEAGLSVDGLASPAARTKAA